MSQQHQKGSAGATVLPFRLARDKATERCVQWDLVGLRHFMEESYAAACEAQEIARKRRGKYPASANLIIGLQVKAMDQILESVGEAEDAAKRALADVVAASPLLNRSYRPGP